MRRSFYCDPAVNTKVLADYLNLYIPGHCNGQELHTLEVYREGAVRVRLSFDPYRPSDKREVFSLSKTFTATAIGLLVTDGLLSPDDYITDLFADRIPAEPSENLKKMKLRHVLSMNTGHDQDTMPAMARAEDAIDAFFAQAPACEPGSRFLYNNGATCLLSCLVQRITGMSELDFLTARLFTPLGLEGIWWNTVASGQNEGCAGIHISADDILTFGRFLLNRGVWNGKRLLSEEWVNEAFTPVSKTLVEGEPPIFSNWHQGYGFQCWMNTRMGFRGDGAWGQLCIVLPEIDAVVAIQGDAMDMGDEIEAALDLAEHLLDPGPTVPVTVPSFAPLAGGKVSGLEGTYYRLDPNLHGWTGLTLRYHPEEDACVLSLLNGRRSLQIRAGSGWWAESRFTEAYIAPKIPSVMRHDDPEPCCVSASYSAEDGTVKFSFRFRSSTRMIWLTLSGDGERISGTFDFRGTGPEGGDSFTGTAVRINAAEV